MLPHHALAPHHRQQPTAQQHQTPMHLPQQPEQPQTPFIPYTKNMIHGSQHKNLLMPGRQSLNSQAKRYSLACPLSNINRLPFPQSHSKHIIHKPQTDTLSFASLPPHQLSSLCLKSLVSPTNNKTKRISFSYAKVDNIQSALRLLPKNKQDSQKQQGVGLKEMIKSVKKSRSMLCSSVHAFTFIPQVKNLQEICSVKKIWSIRSLNLIQIEESENKNEIKQSYLVKQSKIVETEASLSRIMTDSLTESQSKSQPNNNFNRQKSLHSYQSGKSFEFTHPFNQHMTKTIFLSNINYSFGGVIQPNSSQNSQPQLSRDGYANIQSSNEQKGWTTYMKGLLDDGQVHQDMKHSIHCSPDIRHEGIRLNILQNFGRCIKESTFHQLE